MTRPAKAIIDLGALRYNYQWARQRHGKKALAVIKANAYGHGAVRCAQALQGLADGFAVAFLEEALLLRQAGIEAPILVLEGAFDPEEVQLAVTHSLWLVVHHDAQVRMIESTQTGNNLLTIWLKMDSGMHRAGFAPERMAAAHARLMATGKVADITLMSHFARADETDVDATQRQIDLFTQHTVSLPGQRSLCNSAGVIDWPAAHSDWARPGIMLYGVDPLEDVDPGLKPVMQLRSEVFAERWLAPGEALGYGGSFVAEHATRVGLVAMGYADGYPRTVTTGTPVAVQGALTRIVGRVSMDMLTVDLTPLPQAGLGSPVELWGEQVPVGTVARRAGTIAYELLCNVKRVSFHYVDEDQR